MSFVLLRNVACALPCATEKSAVRDKEVLRLLLNRAAVPTRSHRRVRRQKSLKVFRDLDEGSFKGHYRNERTRDAIRVGVMAAVRTRATRAKVRVPIGPAAAILDFEVIVREEAEPARDPAVRGPCC